MRKLLNMLLDIRASSIIGPDGLPPAAFQICFLDLCDQLWNRFKLPLQVRSLLSIWKLSIITSPYSLSSIWRVEQLWTTRAIISSTICLFQFTLRVARAILATWIFLTSSSPHMVTGTDWLSFTLFCIKLSTVCRTDTHFTISNCWSSPFVVLVLSLWLNPICKSWSAYLSQITRNLRVNSGNRTRTNPLSHLHQWDHKRHSPWHSFPFRQWPETSLFTPY